MTLRNLVLIVTALELEDAVGLLPRSHRVRASFVRGCRLAASSMHHKYANRALQILQLMSFSKDYSTNIDIPRSTGHKGDCLQSLTQYKGDAGVYTLSTH